MAFPKDFGKYELLEEIAQGAYGIVYRAKDKDLKRIVALKMLKNYSSMDSKQIERFHREAQFAANLANENIAKVYEFGEVTDSAESSKNFYFTMEFIEGAPLSKIIAEQKITLKDATLLIEKVAWTLYYAHSRGVIHRDIKPANIIINKNNEPIITDFGIARHLDSNTLLTQTGELIGTPTYMSPEQISGNIKEVDETSDIFSLGAVLYELITYQSPFKGDNFFQLSFAILNDDPIPPTKLNPEIPKDLETICLKALNKDKKHRYQSMEEFAQDLKRFSKGETILAKPIGFIGQTMRKIKRHKILVIGFLILAIAVSIFIIYKAIITQQAMKVLPKIVINTNPTGAEVTAFSKTGNIINLGKTPISILYTQMPKGYYTIKFRKDEYMDFSMPLLVDKYTDETVSLHLFKEGEIPEGMVYVPGGEFLMGDPSKGLKKVYVKPFFIDKYEVTNAQYKKFLDETQDKDLKYRGSPPTTWKNEQIPQGCENKPVTDISYKDALAYARWLGKRLPKEEEWEKAVRGVNGRIYPWGDNFDSKKLNSSENGLRDVAPIGSYKDDLSPYGCYDMAGNVCEFTSLKLSFYGKIVRYDTIICGGSYYDKKELCTVFSRRILLEGDVNQFIGFRCAMDASE